MVRDRMVALIIGIVVGLVVALVVAPLFPGVVATLFAILGYLVAGICLLLLLLGFIR